ncbi:hypothetical protein B0T36_23210 [Nocardia donostiensis]|nr:hypothetical protein B0T36_23210 [Nocardia donostiensis]
MADAVESSTGQQAEGLMKVMSAVAVVREVGWPDGETVEQRTRTGNGKAISSKALERFVTWRHANCRAGS